MPSASGSSSVSAYADTWSTPSPIAASSVADQASIDCPGTSYSRSTDTDRIAGRPRLRDRVDDVGRPMPPAQPPEQRRVERLGAERDPVDARRDAAPRASPRSSGPGLASIVTSAPSAMPKRSRTRPRIAAMETSGSRVGVPPPR